MRICWSGSSSTNIGRRRRTTPANPHIVNLTEIYACDWWDGAAREITRNGVVHHWQSPTFLDGLVTGIPSEPRYYFWGQQDITGVKIYDNVSFQTSPVHVKTLTSDYPGYNPGSKADKGLPTLGPTNSNSISISRIHSTPFRASFAVANKDQQVVFLSAENNKIDQGEVTPLSLVANYNKLSDSHVVEKIIDGSSIANSIQLSAKWVQSTSDAEILVDKIALLANSFNNEVTVTIFGNPLIQTGDICQFVYSLKNIGYDPENSNSPITEKMFFVKSVKHNYGAGLKTDLVLKPLFNIS